MAPPPTEHEEPTDIQKDLVMRVELDDHNRLTCDGSEVTLHELSEKVVSLASVNRTSHVISIQADPMTTYEAYFRMQEAVVSAYQALRQQYAQQHYGKEYRHCNSEERAAVNDYYPQRISEAPIEEGGNQ